MYPQHASHSGSGSTGAAAILRQQQQQVRRGYRPRDVDLERRPDATDGSTALLAAVRNFSLVSFHLSLCSENATDGGSVCGSDLHDDVGCC